MKSYVIWKFAFAFGWAYLACCAFNNQLPWWAIVACVACATDQLKDGVELIQKAS